MNNNSNFDLHNFSLLDTGQRPPFINFTPLRHRPTRWPSARRGLLMYLTNRLGSLRQAEFLTIFCFNRTASNYHVENDLKLHIKYENFETQNLYSLHLVFQTGKVIPKDEETTSTFLL